MNAFLRLLRYAAPYRLRFAWAIAAMLVYATASAALAYLIKDILDKVLPHGEDLSLIAALIIVAAWRLLRDTGRVLLEGAPPGIDVGAVRAALSASDGVDAVHHLHVWSLDSARVALSAHVVLSGPLSLHDAQERAHAMKAMLASDFGIEHATIEVECHACVDEADQAAHSH